MTNVLHTIHAIDNKRTEIWNEWEKLYEKFDTIKDQTFSALQEEFNKHIKFTKKWNQLKNVDDATWEVYDNAVDNMNQWCNDPSFTLDKKVCATATITRSKGSQIATNTCSLCLETHDTKHAIRTSCGHYFGKKCFAAFLRHKYFADELDFSCPNCRQTNVTLTHFKFKK
jgi:hypothetical protein